MDVLLHIPSQSLQTGLLSRPKLPEFLFYPECHNIMDVARYRLEHNIEFSALSEKGKKYFNLEAYAHELEEKGRHALCNNGMFKL